MTPRTQALWDKQDQHKGDRWRLFQTIGAAVPAQGFICGLLRGCSPVICL